jgi:hypothetical protein
MPVIVTIASPVLENLKACERAWHAVTDALLIGNPDFLQGPGTGIDCAVREIARLQRADALARKMTDAVGRAAAIATMGTDA